MHVLGDVLVTVPEESQADKQVVRKAANARVVTMDPAVRRATWSCRRPAWRTNAAIGPGWPISWPIRFGLECRPAEHLDLAPGPVCSPRCARAVSAWPTAKSSMVLTAALWQDHEVLREQPGYHEQAFGVAVDVGTTTIAGGPGRSEQRPGVGHRKLYEPADQLR